MLLCIYIYTLDLCASPLLFQALFYVREKTCPTLRKLPGKRRQKRKPRWSLTDTSNSHNEVQSWSVERVDVNASQNLTTPTRRRLFKQAQGPQGSLRCAVERAQDNHERTFEQGATRKAQRGLEICMQLEREVSPC
jgi:hypothetical protein